MDVPQIIAPALSKTVSVKTDLGNSSADEGRPSDLMRIVSNSLNAADALGEVEGLVEIALRQETLDTAREARAGKLLAGRQYAQIIVRDTGTGIPDDILDEVLEHWFSTGAMARAWPCDGSGDGARRVALISCSQPTVAPKSCFGGRSGCPPRCLNRRMRGAPVLTGARILIVDDEEDVANVLANYRKLGLKSLPALTPPLRSGD